MKSFTVVTAEQRSPEWFAARLGRVTGSVADVLYKEGRKKGEESVQRRDLRLRLACERLSGLSLDEDFAKPDYVERGIDMEPAAFAAFEAVTGLVAHRTGFLASKTHHAGCSLDGHVGDFDGILELKCPKTFTHMKYLRAAVVPADYVPQITHNVWISGAQRAWFMSFDNRLPSGLDVFIAPIERANLDIDGHRQRVIAFLQEVDEEMQYLRGLMPQMAVA